MTASGVNSSFATVSGGVADSATGYKLSSLRDGAVSSLTALIWQGAERVRFLIDRFEARGLNAREHHHRLFAV